MFSRIRSTGVKAIKNLVTGWLGAGGAGNSGAQPVLVSKSDSGQIVSIDSALQIAAVWACVRLISETIGSLPFSMYRKRGRVPEYAPEHPLHLIIHEQPNGDTTASVFWEAFVASMLLVGNGFAEKLMIGTRVVGLKFLAPARLTVTLTTAGVRRYWYIYEDGVQREIPASKIFRVPGFTIDGDWGVSAISYGVQVIGSAQSAEKAAAKSYESGLMPTTAFTYPGKLSPDQRDDAREYILQQSGALNSGKPVIMEAGMTATPIGINPKDAQLLESRQHSREDICAWFRVPPWMVGYGEKNTSWGTGMEQQMIAFLTFVLAPWLKRIEQYVRKDLLMPMDRAIFYPRFGVEGILRADSKARSEFYDKMIKAGVMSPDEARELEDLEPHGGNAAKLMVNSATNLLDDLGGQVK